MDKNKLTAEILRLTLLCQEGTATEDECARLDVLLADDAHARRTYLFAAGDTVTLVNSSIAAEYCDSNRPTSSERCLSRQSTATGPPEAVENGLLVNKAAVPTTSRSSIGRAPWPTKQPGKLVGRWTLMALAGSLLVGLGWSLTSWFPHSAETPLPAGSQPTMPGQSFAGRIINLANVAWSSGADQFQEWSRIQLGDRLRFDSGALELMLDNGAQVVIEGPADFELASRLKAIARLGKLVVRCGPDAHGFQVETSVAKVMDLGTIFGMSVVDQNRTDVVVYEGKVDLSIPAKTTGRKRHLSAGEALQIRHNGKVDRIASVQSNTFLTPRDLISHGDGKSRLIASVSDSLQADETTKYYRIIGGGFFEDCRAYVDRLHQWNGLDSQGLPRFLLGGDYVMTFNDDKLRKVKIALELSQPASVYVLLDDRISPPDWLTHDFADTGWDVGLDAHIVTQDRSRFHQQQCIAAIGPGRSIDRIFSVWQRDVPAASVVELGSLRQQDLGDVDPYSVKQNMYGVVVQPLRNSQPENNSPPAKGADR